MRRALMTAFAATAIGLATATPAAATTLQLCTSGASCVSGTTNVNLGAYTNTTPVFGTVGIGGDSVRFTSNGSSTLLDTNTGAATIFTHDGSLLTQLTFTLLTGTFTSAEFNLLSGSPTSFNVTLTASDGTTTVIPVSNSNGSNIFDVIGGAGQSYTSASFSTTGGAGFNTFKQLRLVLGPGSAPAPEPSTWALMLLGFGGIGMAMRRSRRRGKQALMQIA